ncbi:hypothetical protein [Mesorhizobium sp. M0060]|uniref:hypothetical protein n=1 Tax=Mesorhizobium sp. M0060 TaxID=2956866 RepID=UPI00333E01AD
MTSEVDRLALIARVRKLRAQAADGEAVVAMRQLVDLLDEVIDALAVKHQPRGRPPGRLSVHAIVATFLIRQMRWDKEEALESAASVADVELTKDEARKFRIMVNALLRKDRESWEAYYRRKTNPGAERKSADLV